MILKPSLARTSPFEPPPASPTELPPESARRLSGFLPAAQRPTVTLILIGVNVLMWLLTAAVAPGHSLEQLINPDPQTLLLLGAKYGPPIRSGEYWRLVTVMFLHGGILHLAVNMWALLQLGMFCEILYGRARFLVLYVCSGVIGAIASYEFSDQLGVGASGAIFGLFGVALMYSVKYRNDLPPGVGDRMLRSLIPTLLLNLAITFGIPIIDKWAHLGGLFAGATLATITESRTASPERRQREILPLPAALLTTIGLLGYGAWALLTTFATVAQLDVAARAEQRGHAGQAIRIVERAMRRPPPNETARKLTQFTLWELLLAHGQSSEAVRQFLSFSHAPRSSKEIVEYGLALAGLLDQARHGVEAETVYRRLLALDPNNPEVLNGLAYVEADLLDAHLDEAEQLVKKALTLPPDANELAQGIDESVQQANMLDTLAWAYYKEGKLDVAVSTQQQALQLLNRQPVSQSPVGELHYHMGAIQAARGDLAGARSEYETALRLDPANAEARTALARLEKQAPLAPPARPEH